MGRSHPPVKLPVVWCVTEFSGGVQCCVETREHSAARHCVEFHSSATEDVDHVTLWQGAILVNCVASKIGFQPLDPDTGAPLHE